MEAREREFEEIPNQMFVPTDVCVCVCICVLYGLTFVYKYNEKKISSEYISVRACVYMLNIVGRFIIME